MKIFNNTSIVGAQGAQGGSQSNSPPLAGNFLRKEGDFMIGGFGLHPILVTVDTGVIDARLAALVGGVAQSNYSSRLIVNGEGSASDDIDQILSERMPGMMMVIQGIVGQVLTIKHLAKGGGDEDIRTPDGLDFLLTGTQNITLIYDSVSNEWAFMDGALSVAGANRTLSNLISPTAFNQSLIPSGDNSLDIASGAARMRDVFTHDLRIGSLGVGVVGARQVYGTSSGVRFNTPLALKFFWDFNNVVKFDMSSSSFTGPNIILSNTLTINDSSGDPSANGQLRRNVNDLKVQTGGVVKNFTQMAEKNVINVFSVNQQFDEDVILGSSSVDLITFNGDTVGHIEPSVDDVDDLANANERFRNLFIHDTIDLLEGFAAATTPTGQTNRAILFSRPSSGGKTEFRVKFQTGTSVLIAIEP